MEPCHHELYIGESRKSVTKNINLTRLGKKKNNIISRRKIFAYKVANATY